MWEHKTFLRQFKLLVLSIESLPEPLPKLAAITLVAANEIILLFLNAF